MSDKRSVATDALETLGTIIDDKQKRDAIHLAVIPAIAGRDMNPGQHVTLNDGVAVPAAAGTGTGIVDPFVTTPVERGQRFWLVIYPRTIQSLRHVWSHPAFPDEPMVGAPVVASDIPVWTKEKSERWLREFCDRSDCPSYEYVMDEIGDGSDVDEYGLHVGRDASGEIPPEFWDHVEIVIGRKVAHRPTYFSCSC